VRFPWPSRWLVEEDVGALEAEAAEFQPVGCHHGGASCSNARKWVSRRRRPNDVAAGGGSITSPQRASSGPASRIEARIRAHSTGSRSAARMLLAWIASVLRCRHSADAPTDRISSTSVSVSRMRGTFSSVTGCSVSNAAAMIGNAAFLFPEGAMVPVSRWPPSTMYWSGTRLTRPHWR